MANFRNLPYSIEHDRHYRFRMMNDAIFGSGDTDYLTFTEKLVLDRFPGIGTTLHPRLGGCKCSSTRTFLVVANADGFER